MDGPEGAAARAAEWLYGRLPDRLRIIEERLELEPGQLADPAQVLAHERGPIGLEDWPSVFVLPLRTVKLELVDVEDGGGETYLVTYALRVLAWVRADGYEATDRLRHRYALAVREALLERKSLKLGTGLVAGDPHADLSVDPSSIREDYSDVLEDEAARTIAGVDVTVNVTVRELLAPPPALGTVITTRVDEVPLPTHPSLS